MTMVYRLATKTVFTIKREEKTDRIKRNKTESRSGNRKAEISFFCFIRIPRKYRYGMMKTNGNAP
jgi:hypothetical protein